MLAFFTFVIYVFDLVRDLVRLILSGIVTFSVIMRNSGVKTSCVTTCVPCAWPFAENGSSASSYQLIIL